MSDGPSDPSYLSSRPFERPTATVRVWFDPAEKARVRGRLVELLDDVRTGVAEGTMTADEGLEILKQMKEEFPELLAAPEPLPQSKQDPQRDAAEAELADFISRTSINQARKAATRVLCCRDCRGMIIAMLMPFRGYTFLLTRRRAGGFETSVELNEPFWGDLAFCRRRQWAISPGWLTDTEGGASVFVTHAMKSGGAVL